MADINEQCHNTLPHERHLWFSPETSLNDSKVCMGVHEVPDDKTGAAAIERYEDGCPKGDGHYVLFLKEDPFNYHKYTDNQQTTVLLEFRDHRRGFSYDEHFWRAHHDDGTMRMYSLHNILHINMVPNSVEVQEALKDWRMQKELEETEKNPPVQYPPTLFGIPLEQLIRPQTDEDEG